MKFIGQYIQSFIARFRNDIYLEDISTGTITSGGNLGLDSNNKIVKATDSAPDADASTKGIVELATTDETTTGTDATRAVTPDGLKDGYYGSTIIRTVGTIATGTWQGTAINATYLDGQSGTNTGDETTASVNALDITEVGTIDSGVWNGTSISTTYTDAKVTSIVAGDGIDVSGATGDVTVTAETATDSNPGVVELATTAEAVTGTDTARAVTPAGLAARVSQIINLKGYVTLQNDVYDYANPYNSDDEAPFQLDTDYGSGTIGSSTEVTQASFMRSNGFHVPFACTVSALQVQASVNGSGGGNVTAALVEYRPSTAGGDTNDYPRTVYEEVNVAANNNNNKIATTTIAAGDLDATAVPAGSHLMIMVKGDSDTVGDLAIVSMSVGLSW